MLLKSDLRLASRSAWLYRGLPTWARAWWMYCPSGKPSSLLENQLSLPLVYGYSLPLTSKLLQRAQCMPNSLPVASRSLDHDPFLLRIDIELSMISEKELDSRETTIVFQPHERPRRYGRHHTLGSETVLHRRKRHQRTKLESMLGSSPIDLYLGPPRREFDFDSDPTPSHRDASDTHLLLSAIRSTTL